MEELNIESYEYNFLKLMGIESINEQLIDVSNGNDFEFVDSEFDDYGSGESGITYTFIDKENNSIKFVRRNLSRGFEEEVYLEKNGYKYVASGKCNRCEGYYGIEKQDNNTSGCLVEIRIVDQKHALITTEILDFKGLNSRILCTPSNIYTDSLHPGNSIEYFGEKFDYSDGKYIEILTKEIKKFDNSEFATFLFTVLPNICEIHESARETFKGQKIRKISAKKYTLYKG